MTSKDNLIKAVESSVTVKQAADKLGVTRSGIYWLLKEYKLEIVKNSTLKVIEHGENS